MFEISCLERIAEKSSVVLDSRGVYMCDWDKGMPDDMVPFSYLHTLEREDDWEHEIRPNCELISDKLTSVGHLKVWTFRSAAAVLRLPEVRRWQEELKWIIDAPSRQLMEMAAEAERLRNYDWQEALDGLAWLGLGDMEVVEQDEEEPLEAEDTDDGEYRE